MRWILFILFCLLGAPAHAVSIPGVTTTTTTDSTTEPAPEPDIEQKKAAYGALADVLDNDTSRKELIDQLRTVAPIINFRLLPGSNNEKKNSTIK